MTDLSTDTDTTLPPPPAGMTGWPWEGTPACLSAAMPDGSPWPRITVVTPSYHQAAYLEATIRSVLLQGYPNLEYIVMDGGSTDGSVAIIEKYAPWLSSWVSAPDGGQSHAIAAGFSRATGTILAWMNSDDLFLPGALARVAVDWQAHPEANVLYGDCRYIDTRGEDMSAYRSGPYRRARLLRWDYLAQPSTFFRRDAFERVGGLDTGLRYAMDYDLWLKLAREGTFVYSPTPFSCYRLHGTSKTVAESQGMQSEDFALMVRTVQAERLSAEEMGQIHIHLLNLLLRLQRQDIAAALRMVARITGKTLPPLSTVERVFTGDAQGHADLEETRRILADCYAAFFRFLQADELPDAGRQRAAQWVDRQMVKLVFDLADRGQSAAARYIRTLLVRDDPAARYALLAFAIRRQAKRLYNRWRGFPLQLTEAV